MAKRTEYRDTVPMPVDVEITSKVPVPAKPKRELRLPFDKMKIGDSFFIPTAVGKGKIVLNRLRNASGYYRLHNDPNFFATSRIERGGVRLWRIEKPANYEFMRERAFKANAAKKAK